MSNSTTSRIDFLLAARDNASATLRSVSNEMKGLDNAAGMLAGGLSALSAGAGVAGLAALVGVMDELARRGAVFEQLGSVLGDYAASVGSSADAMVAAAKKAAAGTISEFELILNANRAIQFEVAKTPEAFAKLIELSTALGRAQGIADTEALGYLTTGLARESRLILDNLGLIIDIDGATANYAATLGKSAGELTQAERKQALLNAAYDQATVALQANRDASNSAATQYERLDANVQNLKDTLGELIALASADKIGALADGIGALVDRIRDPESTTLAGDLERMVALRDKLKEEGGNADIYTAFGPKIEGDPAGLMANLNKVIEEGEQKRLKLLATEQLHNTSMQEAATLSLQAGDAFTYQANAALNAAAALAEDEAAAHALARASALAAIDTAALSAELDKLAGSNASAIISGAKSIIPIVGAERAKEIAKAQLRTLQEQSLEMEKQGVDGLDLTFQMEELRLQTTGVFEDIRDADRAAQKMATQTVPQIDRAFEELRGKVAGVLSGALDTGTGVDPDEILAGLGFRSDAINENARRLADVAVKGFDSPWYEYFRTEFPALFQQFFAGATSPDGVKAQAANLLKNFQDGLNPELLDKETAKERVRRMLIGEAKMEELATEIANELAAELGNVSVGQAGAAARIALGLSAEDVSAAKAGVDGSALLPSPGIGQVTEQYGGLARTALDAFSEAARTYTEEANLGLEITGVLAGQLGAAASLEMIRGAARSQGAMWGSTFKESIGDIPEFIIDLIALRVVPRVEAAQQQQATTTGAR